MADPTIVEARISAGTDDVEERNSGSIKFGSSDLELVDDGTKRPDQTIGLRFNGLEIPQGAVIVDAYVQFQVDEVDTGSATLQIRGEDTDHAAAFIDTAFDVSSRLLTATDATATWTPPAWTTVGAAGAEQQTSDISSIIQEIVNRAGWSPANSIALIITGSGERTAESFDGNAAAAPLLHIEYLPPGPPSDPVAFDIPADSDTAADQVAELAAAGDPVGITVSATDPDTGDTVTYSVDDPRFVIDANGVIARSGTGSLDFETEPTITLNVTATSSDTSTATRAFTIAVGDMNEAPYMVAPIADTFALQDEVFTLSVAADFADDDTSHGDVLTFTATLAGGGVLPSWLDFNGASGLFSGTPTAGDLGDINVTVTASDGDPLAPLSVSDTFTLGVVDGQSPPTIVESRISSSTDDVEERNSGSIKFSSSDLELVDDGSKRPDQTIGLRFNGLEIPQGAVIVDAYVQFQADEVDTGTATLQIHGEDTDDAATFANTTFDVSSRLSTATDATVTWTPPAWTTVGAAGAEQQTSDISSIIQEIVDRPGWSPANSIALIITGSGERTAESFDGNAAAAPLLHIEYQPPGPPSDPVAFDIPADSDAAADQIAELAAAGDPVGITASAADPDTGDTVTYSVEDPRFVIDANGVITRSGTGTLDFETEPTITLNVTATSSDTSTATRAFIITVDDVNESPTANDDIVATQPATPVSVDVLANDGDPDGDILNLTGASDGANGAVVVNPDDTVTYTPDAGFIGIDNFTYTISDGNGETGTAQVTVSVSNVNLSPTGITVSGGSVVENVAGGIIGILNVNDPNLGDTHTFNVSDSRFEVFGDQLKLKDGNRLDFEVEPQVDLEITATDSGGMSVTESFAVAVTDVDEVRFAAFGDYGIGSDEQAVADLIASLNVDFIVTTGDNVYSSGNIDDEIGQYYSDFIGNYTGSYGSGSEVNRFFPSIGDNLSSINDYLDYFTLPQGQGGERYYDFEMGPVHFFAVNSESSDPDGADSTSIQGNWLQTELANSDSLYNIVYFHHPAYNSNGSKGRMQWPFEDWGATAVFAGHRHNYERVMRDDNGDGEFLPYITTGLGGASISSFGGSSVAGSVAQYDGNFGTLLVQASDASITFEFVSIEGGGTVVDSYTIDVPGAEPLSTGGGGTLSGGVGKNLLNSLSGSDRISDFVAGQGTDDRVDLAAFGPSGFDDLLRRPTDIGTDAVNDPDYGGDITLVGVQDAHLQQTDFLL